jgi:tRNA A22 N-methylase
LTKDTVDLKPYIVGNHLIFLILLEDDPTKPLAPNEEIRTFLITNSYDLVEEKIYKQ